MNVPINEEEAQAATDLTLSFEKTVRRRYSSRAFLSTPVPDVLMREVLEDSRQSPSNCNTQPWDIHIVSGRKLSELSRALIEKHAASEFTLDFSFDTEDFAGPYRERSRDQGKAYYQALGIAREDNEGRRRAAVLNYSFFGAPHVALLFMPMVGDGVRVAGDVGMYAQTFLLSLTARGLAGVPQTVLGFFAATVRDILGLPADLKMLFGISFGYPDRNDPANQFRMARDPLTSTVTFHH